MVLSRLWSFCINTAIEGKAFFACLSEYGGSVLKKTVVLVGMMGSGKSAVGKALAADLNVEFRDSDTEIERAADRTIKEIFERDGEAFFRTAEAKVIERLLSGTPMILATGGGAFMSDPVRHSIAARGISVFLDASLATLWDRVKHSKTRPLLQTQNPKTTLDTLRRDRRPTYLKADLVIETRTTYSVKKTMTKVRDALQSANILDSHP